KGRGPVGRWLGAGDSTDRRRVIFLGGRVREKRFGGRPAVGETVLVKGRRFAVVGVMERKLQLSNYFSSDDESVFVPYTAAGDLWDTRYASVLVFSSMNRHLEPEAMKQ